MDGKTDYRQSTRMQNSKNPRKRAIKEDITRWGKWGKGYTKVFKEEHNEARKTLTPSRL